MPRLLLLQAGRRRKMDTAAEQAASVTATDSDEVVVETWKKKGEKHNRQGNWDLNDHLNPSCQLMRLKRKSS